MKLPGAVYSDGIAKGQQTKFNGLNHTLGAGDGELWDMENLTGGLLSPAGLPAAQASLQET